MLLLKLMLKIVQVKVYVENDKDKLIGLISLDPKNRTQRSRVQPFHFADEGTDSVSSSNLLKVTQVIQDLNPGPLVLKPPPFPFTIPSCVFPDVSMSLATLLVVLN